jgi:hypothetical protein
MSKPRLILIAFFLFMLAYNRQALATSVLPISLQRMATAADLIFHGRAISNQVRLDEASGRVATFTTFEIIDVVKGEAGPTHTIKQIGGQLPGSKIRQVIHGVPRFNAGEEYVIFLPKASSLGFASPIGLSQGRFSVIKQNSESVVSNRRAVAATIHTPDQPGRINAPSGFDTSRTGSARLADFLQSVRGMTGE